MAKRILDAARLREVLSYDAKTGRFTHLLSYHGKQAGRPADISARQGYLRVCIDNQQYLSHRLAWFYVTGEWPSLSIDHINGNPLDNRFENLREADASMQRQNVRRPSKTSRTGVLGVCMVGADKYEVQIAFLGKRHYLGRFTSIDEAAQVYLEAKRRIHPGSTL